MDVTSLLKEFKNLNHTFSTNKIWIGGGYVRDKLSGLSQFHDYDVVINGSSAEHFAQEFCNFMSDKLQIKCPKVKILAPSLEKQRSSLIAKVQIKAANLTCDFSNLQVSLDDSIPSKLIKDAETRDFTINALYLDVDTDEILDPLGVGLYHFENGILKCPINPRETFLEDPVRILRGARFVATNPARRFDPETLKTLLDEEVIEALKSKTAIDRIAAETIRLLRLDNYKIGLDIFKERRDIIEFLRDSLHGENTLVWMRRQILDNYIAEYFHVNTKSEKLFFALPTEEVGSQ